MSLHWGDKGLTFRGPDDAYRFDYEFLELWLNKAEASPFCTDRGYVATMILQHLLIWWEGVCEHEYKSDAAITDLTNPDYEERELTPGQEEFLENAYQDKVEQGEP